MARDPVSARDVPLFHPQRDIWAEHFAWAEDATEIVGLTAVGRATVAALRMNRPQLVRVRRMWGIMGEHPPIQLIRGQDELADPDQDIDTLADGEPEHDLALGRMAKQGGILSLAIPGAGWKGDNHDA